MSHATTADPGKENESPNVDDETVYASTRSILWLIQHGWYSPRPAQIVGL